VFSGSGAYAEYICLPEEPKEGVMALKPTNMSFEEATCIPVGGLNALHLIRKGNIQPGQHVLINGAGGSIGTIAIQLAKNYYGAKVTAVDSTQKLDMLRSVGADEIIDYTQDDFTKLGETYDVIFDVVGKAPYSGSIKSLTKKGIYLNGNPSLSRIIRGLWTSIFSRKKVVSSTASYKEEDLVFLREQIESEKIKAVIDTHYPLEQMAEAHDYVESGQKKGNLVITFDEK
jgi:NADPH:quinone reductase-like Zn-dependent oxidoreductase